jgi:parallel beta-helix repeat protein
LLGNSTGNTLTSNTVSNTGYCGIHLVDCSNNQIYNNNLISNPVQAYVEGSGSNNVFNLDKPTGGNFWSDWTGPDADGDGFVDSPYVFSGGQDNLPWAGIYTFTEVGSDIEVTPEDSGTNTSPITLTFQEVTQAGGTSLTISNTGPPPPEGFNLAGVYYYINTTASYTPPVTVYIQYDDTGMTQQQEEELRLSHYENGAWVDVTNLPVDTLNNIICGTVTTLSPFAIFKDGAPPIISKVSANPNVLWPANHKMVKVKVTAVCGDIGHPPPDIFIEGVTCNEPVNGPGDGNTEPDWNYTDDPMVVLLRAERAGSGSGRIYTIHVKCVDASGNFATATTQVTVPHDQGKGKK